MSNDTILREVDEELRGDRLRGLWRRYGVFVIGAAVLVVLAVAANEGWRWWQSSNASRSSDLFYSALTLAEQGDVPAAQEALNTVIASGSGAYPTLARFRQAALLVKDGKTTEAIAAYDALSTSESNQHLRDLALVLAANILVDTGDVAAVQQRVGGLVSPDNSMRNAAREAIGLAQYKAGDLNAAVKTFEEIAADPLASNDLIGRVQVYIGELQSQGAQTADQLAAAAAAPTAAPAAEPTATMAPAEPTANTMAPAEPAANTMAPAEPANTMAPAEPAANTMAPTEPAANTMAPAPDPATNTMAPAN